MFLSQCFYVCLSISLYLCLSVSLCLLVKQAGESYTQVEVILT